MVRLKKPLKGFVTLPLDLGAKGGVVHREARVLLLEARVLLLETILLRLKELNLRLRFATTPMPPFSLSFARSASSFSFMSASASALALAFACGARGSGVCVVGGAAEYYVHIRRRTDTATHLPPSRAPCPPVPARVRVAVDGWRWGRTHLNELLVLSMALESRRRRYPCHLACDWDAATSDG